MNNQANTEAQQDDLFSKGADLLKEKEKLLEIAPSKGKNVKSNSLFYLTDFSGMLSILASGLIRPAAADQKIVEGHNSLTLSRLTLWHGNVPINVAKPSSEGENGTIIIELNASSIKGSNVPLIDRELVITNGSITRVKKDVLCLFPAGVIPKNCVRSIFLNDLDAIGDFKVRMEMMSNLDISGLKFKPYSEIKLGEAICLDTFKRRVDEIRPCKFLEDVGNYKRLNSLGGALLLAPMYMPSSTVYIDALFSIFESITQSRKGARETPVSFDEYFSNLVAYVHAPDGSTSGFIAKTAEVAMLHRAVRILSNLSPTEGLNLTDFVNNIAKDCEEFELPLGEKSKLEKWREFSIELVQAQARPPALGDNSKSLVRRAISLFLMRPTVERLLQARSSSLQPGDQVFFYALMFAGLYEGYSRASREIKKASRTNEASTYAVAALLNHSANEKFVSFPTKLIKAQIDDSKHDNITQLKSVLINGQIVASISTGPSDAMRGLYGRAKSQGYNLEYDFDSDRFHYLFQYEEDRSQKVYITITESEIHRGKEMIRFSSPCRNLNGKGKLSASEMDGFLKSNALTDSHCRFAIDEGRRQLLVIVDQLLSTNDWEEFEYFCTETARVADEYEKKYGVDIF